MRPEPATGPGSRLLIVAAHEEGQARQVANPPPCDGDLKIWHGGFRMRVADEAAAAAALEVLGAFDGRAISRGVLTWTSDAWIQTCEDEDWRTEEGRLLRLLEPLEPLADVPPPPTSAHALRAPEGLAGFFGIPVDLARGFLRSVEQERAGR